MTQPRAKPSDGKTLRLKRRMETRYALSLKDIARFLRVSERQARRYVTRLLEEDAIFLRYRYCGFHYYSLRRKL